MPEPVTGSATAEARATHRPLFESLTDLDRGRLRGSASPARSVAVNRLRARARGLLVLAVADLLVLGEAEAIEV